ncbi:N-acetylglucosamine kinase [Devosia lucknowensis]|uniref:N-acetylglucosamine kinase n=1 Tax=Devosia lucknowensis TaxID=1096929 RepID=A0A1Y6G564_9HYPH|nr:ROK family protein [Devosia lucknowensis]SMQ85322.1 N-acetylglucosamine kinase [Devosia lucknowensis]
MITCFDIGGTTIKAAIARGPGDLSAVGRIPTPRENFDDFVAAVAALCEAGGAPARSAVSISVTGVVDPATGTATVANIACIDGRTLAADLADRLDRPVFVANDADCFALAEAHAGAGRGHRVVFGAILGTGVGGGIVADGKLFRGGGGLSGEWGHGTAVATEVAITPCTVPHFECGCGQSGCVDTIGGARGIERLHRLLHGADLPSTAIIAAWQAGDPQALQTINLHVELVSVPLALTVNIVGPDIIPVGGGLGNAHALVARLDEAVRSRILRRIDRPLVVPAQLTVDAGLIGAASLAFSEGAA